MQLSRRELATVRCYIAETTQLLWSHGYAVTVESDLHKLSRRFGAHGQLFYAVFDPANAAPFDDAFWVNVRDVEGETVATHANAVFRDANFGELVSSGRIWGRGGERLAWSGPPSPIAGDIGHGGCMWVRPDVRDRGLVAPIHTMSMALALWRFGIDVHTGFMFADAVNRGLMRSYGYMHHQLCIDGYSSAVGRVAKLHAVWMTREEMLADLLRRQDAMLEPRTGSDRGADHLVADGQDFQQIAATS